MPASGLIFILFMAFGCSLFRPAKPVIDTAPVRTQAALATPHIRFRPALTNPRLYEIELIWRVKNIRRYQPEDWQRVNDSLDVPVLHRPLLYLWSPFFIERTTQFDIDYLVRSPEPEFVFTDRAHGNRIGFWDLSDQVQEGKILELLYKIRFIAYGMQVTIDESMIGDYQQDSFYAFYTKSEFGIELTPELKKRALRIAGESENPYSRARAFFDEVRAQTDSVQQLYKASASRATETSEAALSFISLCRAAGIPARLVSGFFVDQETKLYRHFWAEFFLPEYGWVPADISLRDHPIGTLTSSYLIASYGTNISLEMVPPWANKKNSNIHNDKTAFLQLATGLSTGFHGDTEIELRVLKADDF